MSDEFYGFDDPDFAEENMLPAGCGYQGYEFGAGRYPDSECFGGRLYDMDSCDDKGNLYDPLDDIPCPMCHPKEAIARYKEMNLTSTWTRKGKVHNHSKRYAARMARSLVRDIRLNRKNKTEPWRRAA